jgi:hypothetical protein
LTLNLVIVIIVPVVMRKGVLCLASGALDGAVHLWAVKNGKLQATFTVPCPRPLHTNATPF